MKHLIPINQSIHELVLYKGTAPQSYWEVINADRTDLIELIRNGVGSPSSWTYHWTPQDLWPWGCNIIFAADGHDWGYTFPLIFETVEEGLAWKLMCDTAILNNILNKIKALKGTFEGLRRKRAYTIYNILKDNGEEAFWSNRDILPTNFYDHYARGFVSKIDKKALKTAKQVEAAIRLIYPTYDTNPLSY